MYKNKGQIVSVPGFYHVSILVLMELCIKTDHTPKTIKRLSIVSILVLMELCIKTWLNIAKAPKVVLGFNPCFNGTMYKNGSFSHDDKRA